MPLFRCSTIFSVTAHPPTISPANSFPNSHSSHYLSWYSRRHSIQGISISHLAPTTALQMLPISQPQTLQPSTLNSKISIYQLPFPFKFYWPRYNNSGLRPFFIRSNPNHDPDLICTSFFHMVTDDMSFNPPTPRYPYPFLSLTLLTKADYMFYSRLRLDGHDGKDRVSISRRYFPPSFHSNRYHVTSVERRGKALI